MPDAIRVTWDYLCPFARNAHVALVRGIRDGALDLSVTFHAFSLTQNHREPGDPPVWDLPPDERGSGVRALEWGIAVRDSAPDAFLDFHLQAFAARHDAGANINDLEVLRAVATACDLDAEFVEARVDTGGPIATLAEEHLEAVERWSVFGVPTFIAGGHAAFVRIMDEGDVENLLRAVELLDHPGINEFKHTTIPR